MPDTSTPNYAFTLPEEGGSPGSWDTKLNAGLTSIDAELAKPRIIQSALSWGATTTIDLSLARVFTGVNTGVATIAFSNVPSATFAVRVLLILTNGGVNVITWPASVVWISGITPSLKTSGVDIVELVTRDGGTTWYGAAHDRPFNRVVGQANTDVGTGALATEVTLHTIAIPANCLGPNGALRIRGHIQVTGTANSKQLKVKYGGSDLYVALFAAGTTVDGAFEVVMANRGATNSQWSSGFHPTNSAGALAATGGSATAVDSTVAQNLIVTGQTTNAADEVTANLTLVEVLRA